MINKANGEQNSDRPEGVKINRNTFINTGNENIRIEIVFHCDISHNVLDKATGNNIILIPSQVDEDTSTDSIGAVHIESNYIGNNSNTGAGIFLQNSTYKTDYTVISHNHFEGGKFGIYMEDVSRGVIITSNILRGGRSYRRLWYLC